MVFVFGSGAVAQTVKADDTKAKTEGQTEKKRGREKDASSEYWNDKKPKWWNISGQAIKLAKKMEKERG
jgi:hypothetical protein